MQLEQIAPNVSLVGIEPASVVTVVAVVPIADGALQVIYKTPDGTLKDRLLNRADEAGITIPECLNNHFQDGSLKISSREPLPNFDPNHVIQAGSVQQDSLTYVIYFPPFYLAHTPGLFEGELAPA